MCLWDPDFISTSICLKQGTVAPCTVRITTPGEVWGWARLQAPSANLGRKGVKEVMPMTIPKNPPTPHLPTHNFKAEHFQDDALHWKRNLFCPSLLQELSSLRLSTGFLTGRRISPDTRTSESLSREWLLLILRFPLCLNINGIPETRRQIWYEPTYEKVTPNTVVPELQGGSETLRGLVKT